MKAIFNKIGYIFSWTKDENVATITWKTNTDIALVYDKFTKTINIHNINRLKRLNKESYTNIFKALIHTFKYIEIEKSIGMYKVGKINVTKPWFVFFRRYLGN